MSGISPLSSPRSSSIPSAPPLSSVTSAPPSRRKDILSTHQESSLEMLRYTLEAPLFSLWKISLFLRAAFNQKCGVNRVELDAPAPSWFTSTTQAKCFSHKLELYDKQNNKSLSDLYFLEAPLFEGTKGCDLAFAQIIKKCPETLASILNITTTRPLSSSFIRALALVLSENQTVKNLHLEAPLTASVKDFVDLGKGLRKNNSLETLSFTLNTQDSSSLINAPMQLPCSGSLQSFTLTHQGNVEAFTPRSWFQFVALLNTNPSLEQVRLVNIPLPKSFLKLHRRFTFTV